MPLGVTWSKRMSIDRGICSRGGGRIKAAGGKFKLSFAKNRSHRFSGCTTHATSQSSSAWCWKSNQWQKASKPRSCALWVVKTSHIHKFNNLAMEPFSSHPIKFSHGSAAPAPPRMGCCCVPFPRGPHPRKPCPASATAGSPRQTTSAATYYHTQAVLGRIAKTLGAMEEASHPGYTPNRCRLAWRRLSAVLEMALQSSTDRRPKSCQQRGSCADFPDGR